MSILYHAFPVILFFNFSSFHSIFSSAPLFIFFFSPFFPANSLAIRIFVWCALFCCFHFGSLNRAASYSRIRSVTILRCVLCNNFSPIFSFFLIFFCFGICNLLRSICKFIFSHFCSGRFHFSQFFSLTPPPFRCGPNYCLIYHLASGLALNGSRCI